MEISYLVVCPIRYGSDDGNRVLDLGERRCRFLDCVVMDRRQYDGSTLSRDQEDVHSPVVIEQDRTQIQ